MVIACIFHKPCGRQSSNYANSFEGNSITSTNYNPSKVFYDSRNGDYEIFGFSEIYSRILAESARYSSLLGARLPVECVIGEGDLFNSIVAYNFQPLAVKVYQNVPSSQFKFGLKPFASIGRNPLFLRFTVVKLRVSGLIS